MYCSSRLCSPCVGSAIVKDWQLEKANSVWWLCCVVVVLSGVEWC
jgi:hypothetical protein